MFAGILTVRLAESLTRSVVQVLIHLVGEMTEERPYTCFADVQTAEIEGVISRLERELLVLTAEISFLASKSDEVFVPHPISLAYTVQFLLDELLLFCLLGAHLHFHIHRQGRDTRLISMR